MRLRTESVPAGKVISVGRDAVGLVTEAEIVVVAPKSWEVEIPVDVEPSEVPASLEETSILD